MMTRKIFFKWRSERDNTIKIPKIWNHMKPFGVAIAFHIKVSHLRIGVILFGIIILIITCLIIRRIKRKR